MLPSEVITVALKSSANSRSRKAPSPAASRPVSTPAQFTISATGRRAPRMHLSPTTGIRRPTPASGWRANTAMHVRNGRLAQALLPGMESASALTAA
jgi:hypothetical protein